MEKYKRDGFERAIRKAEKRRKDREKAIKVLPQITAFVKARVPILLETMKGMESRNQEDQTLLMTWQLFGKRPKIKDSWQFTLMMERSLHDQLEKQGIKVVSLDSSTRNMSFDITWERPLN